jgi:hypothetical protein
MAGLVSASHVFVERAKDVVAATRAAMTFGVSWFNDFGLKRSRSGNIDRMTVIPARLHCLIGDLPELRRLTGLASPPIPLPR